MARKPAEGDKIATGYDFDETAKAFVVRDDWTRDETATVQRLSALYPNTEVPRLIDAVVSWSDDDVQSADLYALSAEAALEPLPDVPAALQTLIQPPPADEPADPAPADPAPADPAPADPAPADPAPADPAPADPAPADPAPADPAPADPAPADPAPADPAPADPAPADPAPADPAPADPAPADPAPADPAPADPAPATAEERDVLNGLLGHKYGLYKFDNGNYGVDGPEYDGALVDQMVAKGWAEVEPTGGRLGSVKITDAGRAAYQV